MTVPNQRDPDSTQVLRAVRDGLADLKAMVISRWGRVPYMGADPVSPPDGSMWIRSDTRRLVFQAAGVRVGSVYRATAVGVSTSGWSVETTVNTLIIPDQGCSGQVDVWVAVRFDKTVGSDSFRVNINNAGVVAAYDDTPPFSTIITGHPMASFSMAAGASKTVTVSVLRTGGTGTGQTYGDPANNRVTVLFTPD